MHTERSKEVRCVNRMSDSDDDDYDPGTVHPVNTALPILPRHVAVSSVEPPNVAPTPAESVQKPSLDSAATATTSPSLPLLHTDYRLRGVTGRVRSLCLNPTGSVLCAGGEGGTLCMWDFGIPLDGPAVKPTRVLTPFPNRISGFQPVISVHAACDGSYYVACQDGDSPALIGSGGRQMGYCAMGQRGMVDVVQCKGHRAPVTSSAPSPTVPARFFTAAQDSTARMWDTDAFDRHSLYAVKHGSGQLMDNVVVESVLPLRGTAGGGSVFATGGEDGIVQLWDTRQKFRPGHALATLDLYAPVSDGKDNKNKSNKSKGSSSSSSTAAAVDGFFDAKHIGGMAEPDPTRHMLCVRRGAEVRVMDLRQLNGPGGSVADLCAPVTGLTCAMDTMPIVPCTSTILSRGRPAFMTCTGREGFQHVAGGHVVQFTYDDGVGAFQPTLTWCPAGAGHDVLALAVEAHGGQIFTGTQNGDVVARAKRVATVGEGSKEQTLETWLAARPMRDMGRKRTRQSEDEWEESDIVSF